MNFANLLIDVALYLMLEKVFLLSGCNFFKKVRKVILKSGFLHRFVVLNI